MPAEFGMEDGKRGRKNLSGERFSVLTTSFGLWSWGFDLRTCSLSTGCFVQHTSRYSNDQPRSKAKDQKPKTVSFS
jgi:hypothetical protein